MTDEISDVITDVDEPEVITEQTTESSTVAVDEQQKETTVDPVQGRINKITAEKYEAKREADALRAQLEEMKQVKEPEPSALIEPEMPADLFDEDAVKQYHKNSAKYYREVAKQEATNAANSHYEQRIQAEQQATAKKAHSEVIRNYTENGLGAGLTIEQMELNEQVVGQSGINSQVGNFIMEQPDAAKLINYLASNANELQELNAMNPMAAALKISELKVKAVSNGSNITKAPDPTAPLKGANGAANEDDIPGLVIL